MLPSIFLLPDLTTEQSDTDTSADDVIMTIMRAAAEVAVPASHIASTPRLSEDVFAT